MPLAFLGLPWQFPALGLGYCLTVSALGFKRVEYFVSLGYAASIAGQAILLPLLYRNSIGGVALLQSALMLAYGLRLGLFIAHRDRVPSFAKQRGPVASVGPLLKVGIWIGVSSFYVVLFLPALLTASAQARGLALPSAPTGVALMAAGLGIETCADWQKSRFKKHAPSRFCDVGLYRVVRFPNYFGEILFWLGVWVSAVSSYRTLPAWVLGSLGFPCIVMVMFGAGRRLELKQARSYASVASFRSYARKVPILFPFLPTMRSKANASQG